MFTFGGGEQRVSKVAVYIPVKINGSFQGIWTHVIPGNTDLLLGKATLAQLGVIIDTKSEEIQFGRNASWVATEKCGKGHMCLTVLPEQGSNSEIVEIKNFLAKNRDKKPVRDTGPNVCGVNLVTMENWCDIQGSVTTLSLIHI